MSKCFYDLLRKLSSQISSVLGCSWHLKPGALTELVHVSSSGTVGKNSLKGHCFIILSTLARYFDFQLLNPMGHIPRAISYMALPSASILRVIKKDGSGWPVMRRESGRPLNLLRGSVMNRPLKVRDGMMDPAHRVPASPPAQSFPLYFSSSA